MEQSAWVLVIKGVFYEYVSNLANEAPPIRGLSVYCHAPIIRSSTGRRYYNTYLTETVVASADVASLIQLRLKLSRLAIRRGLESPFMMIFPALIEEGMVAE